MFGRIRHIAMIVLLWFALASCDKTIHEYPGTHDIKLIVECSVDTSEPTYFTTVECDPETGTSYVVRAQHADTKGTRFTEPVCLRYVIDLYRVTSSTSVFVERKVEFSEVDAPNPQVCVEFTNVAAEQYKVLVWCDYVQDEVREAWYYNTDDLRQIRYSDVEVVDNEGRICPLCYDRIDFEIEGEAKFLGGYNSGRFNINLPSFRRAYHPAVQCTFRNDTA